MLLLLALVGCCFPQIPGCPGGEEESGPVSVTPPRPQVERVRPEEPDPSSDPNAPTVAMGRDRCNDLAEGGPVAGPDCITAEIRCGDVVYGHTLGGTQVFDSRFYERHKCTPRTTNHDSGGERVYRLRMPDGDHRVHAWLDTPCADLDLTVLTTADGDTCPTMDSLVKVCDMWPNKGTKREHVEFATQGATDLLIVVEGKNEEEGSFALTVQCKDGLY